MQVVFSPKEDGWYVARSGDTEVRVFCDDTSWHLNWIKYSSVNECVANWWCEKLDCDLDDLDEDSMDDDGYCFECPREFVDSPDEDSYTSDSWSKRPASLEEARKMILRSYKDVAHNGLTPDNKHLCDMMYGTWSLEA